MVLGLLVYNVSKLPEYKNIPPPPKPPDIFRPTYSQLSINPYAAIPNVGLIYPPEYKYRSTDLVPDQTEEELKELNEYMEDYED